MTLGDPVRRSRLGRFLRTGLFGLAVLVAILGIALQFRTAILEAALPGLLRSRGIPADGLAVLSVDAGGVSLGDIVLAEGRLRIGRLRVDWSPVAWLGEGSQHAIGSIAAEDVEAEVVIDPDGRFRIAGLEALTSGGDTPSTGLPILPFQTASLDRVVLRLSTGLGDAVVRASLDLGQGIDGGLRVSGRISPEGFGGSAHLPLTMELDPDGKIAGDVMIVGGTWRSGDWRIGGLGGWLSFSGSLGEGIDGDLVLDALSLSRRDEEIGRGAATLSIRGSRPTRLLVSAETDIGRLAADFRVPDWTPVEPRALVDFAVADLDLEKGGGLLTAGLPGSSGLWNVRASVELPIAPLIRGDPIARVVVETGAVAQFALSGRGLELAGQLLDSVGMHGVAVRNPDGSFLVSGEVEASHAGRVVRAPLQLALKGRPDRGPAGAIEAKLDAGIEVLEGDGPSRFATATVRALNSVDGWQAEAVLRPAAQTLELPGVGILAVDATNGINVTAEAAPGEVPRVNLSFDDASFVLDGVSMEDATGFVDLDLKTSALAARLSWQKASLPGGAISPVEGLVVATFFDGVLQGEGSLLGAAGLSADFVVTHDTASGEGKVEVEMPSFRFDQGGTRAAAAFPAFAQTGLRAIAGSVAGRAGVSWGAQPSQVAELRLSDVGIASDYGAAAGLSGVVRLDRLWPIRTAGPATIEIPVLDFGTIMTNGRVRVALEGDRVRVSEAGFDWAGGRVSFDPVTTSIGATERRIVLRLEHVDLTDIMREASVEGLSLSGRVTGVVPIRLARDTIAFEDATIASDGPGTLKYVFGSSEGLADTDASVALLVTALQDFRFDSLVVTLNGTLGGDLTAGVKINGANPALYEGYPIALNVNVTGALDSILRRSLETAEIGQRAQEFYQRQVRGR